MTPGTGASASKQPSSALTRRALLLSTGVAVGALGTAAIQPKTSLHPAPNPPDASSPFGEPVVATGAHQAGIARPPIPQQHCIVVVAEVDRSALKRSLVKLGEQILLATGVAHTADAAFPDGSGDLTVTVGLGALALSATKHPDLAKSVSLPPFRGDETLPKERLSGDLYLSICSSDPGILEPSLSLLSGCIVGYRELWSDFGVRAASHDDVSRNPLGYHDGIIVPRTNDELSDNVWIDHGPLTGGTICVIRRFALDAAKFRGLAPAERDAVIGREQTSGVPLSGGLRGDPVSLTAKSDDGQFLTPARSHARAAHPSFTGSDLMLRRSYAYRASTTDHGLLFIAYQKDVNTFSRTQLRLDEVDDLMEFTTPTATSAFAILPGLTPEAPLGSSLF